MTRDAGRDFVVAALLVSAAAHVALMLWARPLVMTRAPGGAARRAHRAPMRVSEAPRQDAPSALSAFEDLQPEREAPGVDAVAVRPPEPPEAPEVVAAEATTPAPPAVPELLSRLRPEDEVPVLESAPGAAAPEAPDPAEPMAFGSAAEAAPAAAAAPSVEFAPPAAAVPSFAVPAALPAAPAETAVGRLPPKPADAEPEFTPPAEVMPEVDAKVVEAEKAAVRELLRSESARDAASAVSLRLESAASGGWSYFRVTVTPAASLPVVPKDVVVLIDASGSIGNDRLASCRQAARTILRTCTNTGDRFNLVAFRDRFAYAFRSWRECDAASFEAGDAWLSRLAAHGRTDVFATISSVLTLPREPSRPLVALVVTDGDANAGVSDTREILSRFTRLNDGLVSIYMYGVKSSANRELIEVLTRGNRGESFVFDGGRWRAGDGIEALSERFRDPVLTDLRVAFAADCAAEAYPTLLRNLYRGNSVAITGRVRGTPREIAFSLRALAGRNGFEGFFRLPLAGSAFDAGLPAAWAEEARIDALIRPRSQR